MASRMIEVVEWQRLFYDFRQGILTTRQVLDTLKKYEFNSDFLLRDNASYKPNLVDLLWCNEPAFIDWINSIFTPRWWYSLHECTDLTRTEELEHSTTRRCPFFEMFKELIRDVVSLKTYEKILRKLDINSYLPIPDIYPWTSGPIMFIRFVYSNPELLQGMVNIGLDVTLPICGAEDGRPPLSLCEVIQQEISTAIRDGFEGRIKQLNLSLNVVLASQFRREHDAQ